MELSGEVELEGISSREVWDVLSDPVAVQQAFPGCEFLVRVEEGDVNFDEYEPEEDIETLPEADAELPTERAFQADEEYAALIKVGVAGDKREFEARVTIDERDYPRMGAQTSGASSKSTFEMTSSMTVTETQANSRIKWLAEIGVSGQIAQLDQRLVIPAANKIVNEFFHNIEEQMVEPEEDEAGSV